MEKELNKILKKCLKKDRRAQFKLYHYSYDFLMSICFRYQKSRDEAEALLNEGFLKVLLNLEHYDFQNDFKNWAATIMVRTAIDNYRSQKSYKSNTLLEDQDEVLEKQSLTEQHTKMLYEMTLEEVKELIFGLPEDLRMVFNLYEMEGYKHKEIAEMLELSERTTKRQLKKAKEILKDRLEHNAHLKKVI